MSSGTRFYADLQVFFHGYHGHIQEGMQPLEGQYLLFGLLSQ
jgi:hypothetical protein